MSTMIRSTIQVGDTLTLDSAGLQQLLDALARKGYRVIGPTVRDGAIIYDDLRSTADLPIGWTDEQDGGTYRLKKRGDGAFFGYVVGPHSWKRFLYPPVLRLWKASKEGNAYNIEKDSGTAEPEKMAFIGVRSCELHAIGIQDRVFMGDAYVDPTYTARREKLFMVAVNCGQPGGTCFCTSMQTGPKATSGYDLALTEVMDSNRHYFVVEIGSAPGAEVMSEVESGLARPEELESAASIMENAARSMGRSMDTGGLKELLAANYEHPRWNEIATRCLACSNCTMVCPTCFCTTVEDVTDLTGENAERWRKWDSCFTGDFSYIHGGSIRNTTKSRYRQWMTHKLSTWFDQFGTSGCVGCGRCITWCPVGIDITEEARIIRETAVNEAEEAATGPR